jgi:Fe-S cluster assembly scaffold protein SufB
LKWRGALDSKVILSSILKDETKDFVITVPKNLTITVIDDVFSFKKKLTFIVQENASLSYEFRLIKKTNIKEIKKDLEFSCIGSGASVFVKCAVESISDQKIIFKTVQNHSASNTKSELIINGVQHDKSRLISENLIRIEKGISKVIAYEKNKNLLLGDYARVTTIPKLEVQSHDVSCHHGATVSRFSDDDLFYFQARGINCDLAKKALIEAFLGVGG